VQQQTANGGGEGPLMLRGPVDKCDTWVAMLRACAAGCRSLSRDGITCDAQCRSLALRDAMEWTHDDFALRQPWAARHTRRPMLFGRGGGREGTRSAAAAYFGQLCLYALERCADCARRGVALDAALQHLEPFSERLYHCTREMNADPSRGGRCLLDYAGITKAVHGTVWEMANALATGVERKHEAGRGSIRDDLAFDIGDWIRTAEAIEAAAPATTSTAAGRTEVHHHDARDPEDCAASASPLVVASCKLGGGGSGKRLPTPRPTTVDMDLKETRELFGRSVDPAASSGAPTPLHAPRHMDVHALSSRSQLLTVAPATASPLVMAARANAVLTLSPPSPLPLSPNVSCSAPLLLLPRSRAAPTPLAANAVAAPSRPMSRASSFVGLSGSPKAQRRAASPSNPASPRSAATTPRVGAVCDAEMTPIHKPSSLRLVAVDTLELSTAGDAPPRNVFLLDDAAAPRTPAASSSPSLHHVTAAPTGVPRLPGAATAGHQQCDISADSNEESTSPLLTVTAAPIQAMPPPPVALVNSDDPSSELSTSVNGAAHISLSPLLLVTAHDDVGRPPHFRLDGAAISPTAPSSDPGAVGGSPMFHVCPPRVLVPMARQRSSLEDDDPLALAHSGSRSFAPPHAAAASASAASPRNGAPHSPTIIATAPVPFPSVRRVTATEAAAAAGRCFREAFREPLRSVLDLARRWQLCLTQSTARVAAHGLRNVEYFNAATGALLRSCPSGSICVPPSAFPFLQLSTPAQPATSARSVHSAIGPNEHHQTEIRDRLTRVAFEAAFDGFLRRVWRTLAHPQPFSRDATTCVGVALVAHSLFSIEIAALIEEIEAGHADVSLPPLQFGVAVKDQPCLRPDATADGASPRLHVADITANAASLRRRLRPQEIGPVAPLLSFLLEEAPRSSSSVSDAIPSSSSSAALAIHEMWALRAAASAKHQRPLVQVLSTVVTADNYEALGAAWPLLVTLVAHIRSGLSKLTPLPNEATAGQTLAAVLSASEVARWAPGVTVALRSPALVVRATSAASASRPLTRESDPSVGSPRNTFLGGSDKDPQPAPAAGMVRVPLVVATPGASAPSVGAALYDISAFIDAGDAPTAGSTVYMLHPDSQLEATVRRRSVTDSAGRSPGLFRGSGLFASLASTDSFYLPASLDGGSPRAALRQAVELHLTPRVIATPAAKSVLHATC
jgi:hypothetical protein